MVLSASAPILKEELSGGGSTGGKLEYARSLTVVVSKNRIQSTWGQTSRIRARDVPAFSALCSEAGDMAGGTSMWPHDRHRRGKIRAAVKVTLEHTGVSAVSPD